MVVDKQDKLAGIISLDNLKEILVSREAWNWLLAADVMQGIEETLRESMPLKEAMDLMYRLGAEQMPVISEGGDRKPIGILDYRNVRRQASHEAVQRRQSVSFEAAV